MNMFNQRIDAPSVPKRILVHRIFDADKIKDDHFDPIKVPKDHPDWVDIKKHDPSKADVFFVKDPNSTGVGKAIYLYRYDLRPKGYDWYHITEDEYISNYEIGWWMPIYNTTEGK